jgi:hypothetical protein
VQDSQLGITFSKILIEQFKASRDGDRFWYQNYLTSAELAMVGGVRLSDVINNNTDANVQQNVFFVPNP